VAAWVVVVPGDCVVACAVVVENGELLVVVSEAPGVSDVPV
jgi:hypothetical protein